MNLAHKMIVVLLPLFLTAYGQKPEYPDQQAIVNSPEDWENPAVFGRNKEEPRAAFIPYKTVEQVMANKPLLTALR